MSTPSRRAAVLTGTFFFSLTAALTAALLPSPARAQMLGGMGGGIPGLPGGRSPGAPIHGGAGPVTGGPQPGIPMMQSGSRFSGPPMGGGMVMGGGMGMSGGLPMRSINPGMGFPNNIPLRGGLGYSNGMPQFPNQNYGPQNYGPQNNYPQNNYPQNNYPQNYGPNFPQGNNDPASQQPLHVRGQDAGNMPPPVRSLAPRPAHGGVAYTTPSQNGPPISTIIPNPYYNPFANNGVNGGYTYAPVVAVGGPALLGGYYYGNYCDTYYGADTYPTVYSAYDGFPAYIYSVGPGVTITSIPSVSTLPTYIDPPQAFQAPQYTVNYNQNNYYVTNEAKAADLQAGGDQAKAVLPQAFPADSYQAALADIERAWTGGDLTLLANHFRTDDTKISVFLRDKYKYSLDSSDFGQITRDAFDRLNTVSFKFTEIRKAKNGDITGFGKHVYTVADSGKAATGDLIPFDSSAPAPDTPDAGSSPNAGSSPGPDPGADSSAAGPPKTVYVSYTLRHGDGLWYIVAINSSPEPLAKQ